MRTMTLASDIVNTLVARQNCEKSGNVEWREKWAERLDVLVSNLPSGSGLGADTTLDEDKSGPTRLVFQTSFHHMNDGGMYDGWTEHTVTVVPTFTGLDIKVSGRNRNDIKDYIAEVFVSLLSSPAPVFQVATC